jgi:hypothetical protein
LRGALERLRSTAVASPPHQSGTTGLLVWPSSRACLHAAPGHLRRLHGDPTRPRPKPLNADAARVTNSGKCKNAFSYILADAIGSRSFFRHPECWIHHTSVCTRLFSQSAPRESRTVAKVAFIEPNPTATCRATQSSTSLFNEVPHGMKSGLFPGGRPA